jgi:hypothetical protein
VPIRIAYLLLVHNQPAHVARLVRALDDKGVHFFVHVDVDGKARLDAFTTALPRQANVHFVARGNVYWSDFSAVQAELRLIEAATRFTPSFERYAMMSGADYPIKSREEIREALSTTDRELIRIDHKLTGPGKNGNSAFVDRYHFRAGHLARVARSPRALRLAQWYDRLLKLANRHLGPRRLVSGFPFYKGSSWWCLTDGCVRYVLDFVKKNPEVMRILRFTFVPEEILFQSVLKSSPFADRISQDFEKGPAPKNLHGCHYVDWTTGPTLPRVLDVRDLGSLLSSPALFARKLDPVTSSGLLTRLDARRGRMSPEESALWSRYVAKGTHYWELGAGGSTVRAATRFPNLRSIHTVDHDRGWLKQLRSLSELSRVVFHAVYLGPIGEHGYPTDTSRREAFPLYAQAIRRADPPPDVVFVAGRFRVTCCAEALLHAPGAAILFADFRDQPEYHAVLPFVDVVDRAGTMAVLRLRAGAGSGAEADGIRALAASHAADPR